MSLVIVENNADQPLTDEALHEADQLVLPCLEARNATWQYSLLALDRHRMICTFKAPDTASVRESYLRAGLPSRIIWSGDPIKPETPRTQQSVTVLETTYSALADQDWSNLCQQFLDCCAALSIECLQVYRSLDRTKVIYELNTSDPELVNELQQKLNTPFERVWGAQVIKP